MSDYSSPLRIIQHYAGGYRVYNHRNTCLFGLLKLRTFSECKAFCFGYYLASFAACPSLTEYDF